MGLAKPTEQNGAETVNDDKNISVSVVRRRKITITTVSTIPTRGRLSTASSKMTLLVSNE